jgi:riboflavin kinase/FMN adenylyltransferase
MKIIHSLAEAESSLPSVVTVGNFDGVHRGHQAIFSMVRARALELGVQSAAITFEPHPLTCIAPDRAPTPISTLEQKTRLIEEAGIDVLLIQNFTEEFSRLPAEAFIELYFLSGFHAQALCVGHNFRFGHQHRGDIHTLRASKRKFEVVEVPPVIIGDRPVSSSRLREQIVEGRARDVRRMLGHCYEVEGRIVPGLGRGGKLTVPTLNLDPDNRLLPADGVYLTRIAVDDETWADALTNVGVRPTFSETERTVETYLLNRTPPEGAGRARLRFVARLRDEQKFANADALRKQIEFDRSHAEKFFRRFEHVRQGEALECAPQNPR